MKIWEKSAQAEGTASAELLVREMQKKKASVARPGGWGAKGRGSDKCQMIKVLGGPAGVRISFFLFLFSFIEV